MTISEIKDLTRFLSEEEVEKIKQEIKSKEQILKSGNIDEEEMIEVLNTLFAILVIEKTLESEIEDVEEIRDELEAELLESYNIYDAFMARVKKEDKKKKKRWLLNFLFLSDDIRNKKDMIGASNKTIDKLQKELNNLRKQKSDENLKSVVNDRDDSLNKFRECPHECKNPKHHHNHEGIRERLREKQGRDMHRHNPTHEPKKDVERNMNKPEIKKINNIGYEPKINVR